MKNVFDIKTALAVAFLFAGTHLQAQWGEENSEWGNNDPWQTGKVENQNSPNYGKTVYNYCNRDSVRKVTRNMLRPYHYSNARTTMITFKDVPQHKEIAVPVFSYQQHLMVFTTHGLPQGIRVRLYDGPKSYKKRQLLYEMPRDAKQGSFEVPDYFGGFKLFVEYYIPPSEQEEWNYINKGCTVMMIGYLDPEELEELGEGPGGTMQGSDGNRR